MTKNSDIKTIHFEKKYLTSDSLVTSKYIFFNVTIAYTVC